MWWKPQIGCRESVSPSWKLGISRLLFEAGSRSSDFIGLSPVMKILDSHSPLLRDQHGGWVEPLIFTSSLALASQSRIRASRITVVIPLGRCIFRHRALPERTFARSSFCDCEVMIGLRTLLQKPTQARFWIHLKIATEYDYRMPRLPENQKIKVPQVGSLTKIFQK